ncbi:DNA-binding FadR family transcriptional regulator [Agromyces cerinus]|uniref:DNA-binding FadR family transcriptional regulator n=1 Tax=Agromyces hippuratus TaxID=286438 RepID=A0A852WVW3_9MICO|nr:MULTISPECIES: GntR family transcriptional regulator [Agromyces]MBM7831887.1 DNA-binding FadR family transcriptional regulator [Agromyces cerinus]NYG22226.1 DNA-binding FadR family transcriptional regulator [Agromyces hippuratus]
MESRVGPGAREAVFAQLADTGRAEQVAQRLTDGIVLGVLGAGERLPSEPELARRFGVALITVREGLGILREAGLVETRRGREGGSFVVADDADHRSLITARLRGLAQVELSDMAVYFGAILAGIAERAAERASAGDAERLAAWLAAADFGTAASARTNQGGFFLEVAVLSQSARLVREQIRLQAEFGPLLLLGLDDDGQRADASAHDRRIVRAVAAHRPAEARESAGDLVRGLSVPLLAAKARIERGGALDEPVSA